MIGILEQNRGIKFKVSTLRVMWLMICGLPGIARHRSYVILVVNSVTYSFVTVSNARFYFRIETLFNCIKLNLTIKLFQLSKWIRLWNRNWFSRSIFSIIHFTSVKTMQKKNRCVSCGIFVRLTGTAARCRGRVHPGILEYLDELATKCANILFDLVYIVLRNALVFRLALFNGDISSYQISHDTLISKVSLGGLLDFSLRQENQKLRPFSIKFSLQSALRYILRSVS